MGIKSSFPLIDSIHTIGKKNYSYDQRQLQFVVCNLCLLSAKLQMAHWEFLGEGGTKV